MRRSCCPIGAKVYHEAPQDQRTLLLTDTTEFDFSTHPVLKGIGLVGNSRENIRFRLHTVLAMNLQTQLILGCITLEPFLRKLTHVEETQAQLQKRGRSVKHIGRVPESLQWIYVKNSGGDIYTFWQTCEDLGYDFVLQVAQDSDVETPKRMFQKRA